MRTDEMQEAAELGFLDLDGKRSDSVSTRLPYEALCAIDALAAMDDIKRSEWVRDACIEKLVRLKRQHDYLSKAFGGATNTKNTSNTENT